MKRKKPLIIIGVILLMLTLIGLWGYNEFLKPDAAVQQQLYDQFGEDFFSFDDNSADYPKDPTTQEAMNNALPAGTEPVVVKPPVQGETRTQEDIKVSDLPGGQETGTTTTEEEISSKYKERFTYLQNLALSRLDTLFNSAIQEYQQSKKSGKVDRGALFQKYFQAATTLESGVDGQFYSVLGVMEAELKAAGLPTGLVGTYRDIYEKAKSDKRAQLLAKAR